VRLETSSVWHCGKEGKTGAALLDEWMLLFCRFFFPGLQRVWTCCPQERLFMFSFGFGCFSLETRHHLKRHSRVVQLTIDCQTRRRDIQPEMEAVYPAGNDGSFQLSMYRENILRPLRGFVIKSNLNKIITLLFINWKLVTQVLQALNCAPGDAQCRGDFCWNGNILL